MPYSVICFVKNRKICTADFFLPQFVKLREAVEKYRQEAAEAIQKYEKSEEKLQECTREQDEVNYSIPLQSSFFRNSEARGFYIV